MVRSSRLPAILKIKKTSPISSTTTPSRGPRLYNGNRRIKSSSGLTEHHFKQYQRDTLSQSWRKRVSPDIQEYIDKADLLPEEKERVLRHPARYFSRPHNVPTQFRKQIYFPSSNVVLMRTPNLPPRYAAFDVPLEFNKLDMKSYLKELYNVDVVHIRSVVIQSKVERKRGLSPTTAGPLFRPKSKKKMTVQLVEPFVWPDEITDMSAWEKDTFWHTMRAQVREQREASRWFERNPDEKHQKSIAEQARELLQGKAKWKPTWQSIPADNRVMEGAVTAPPR